MQYRLETTPEFDKQIKKLNKLVAKGVIKWLIENVEGSENPKQHGKQLKHNLKEYWRYRIGDYRVFAKIESDKLLVLAVKMAHRREVYDK